eukprot:3274577-Lingulodinium_polyedra.AAC.1
MAHCHQSTSISFRGQILTGPAVRASSRTSAPLRSALLRCSATRRCSMSRPGRVPMAATCASQKSR